MLYRFITLLILLLAAPAWGATLTVCASGCSYTTLQNASNAAVADDIIDGLGATFTEAFVAAADGGGDGGGVVVNGPYLMAVSDDADLFTLVLADNEEALIEPDADGWMSFDLSGLGDGLYTCKIRAARLGVFSEAVEFSLYVGTKDHVRTWRIITVDAMEQSDPDYLGLFSDFMDYDKIVLN